MRADAKTESEVLFVLNKSAEAFRKKTKVKISISGTGSGDGIKSIIEGLCDIANSSRDIKPKEIEKAKKRDIKL